MDSQVFYQPPKTREVVPKGPAEPGPYASTSSATSTHAGGLGRLSGPQLTPLISSSLLTPQTLAQPSVGGQIRRRASFSETSSAGYSDFWNTLKRGDPGITFTPIPFDPHASFSRTSEPSPPSPSPTMLNSKSTSDSHFADPFINSENDSQPSSIPSSTYASFWTSYASGSAETTLVDSSVSVPRTSTPASNRTFGTNSTNQIDFSQFGKFTSSDDFTASFRPATPSPSPMKRKKEVDPNSPSNMERKKKRDAAQLSTAEKLEKVFDLLSSLDWSLGEFMHHTFAHKGVSRSASHGHIVQRYLSGRNKFNIAEIVQAWLTSPDGAGADLDSELYTLAVPYTELSHVRSILTSFAAQTVKTKLLQDVRIAVRKSSGLHAPISRKKDPESMDTDPPVGFAELGGSLMSNMKVILEDTQGLLYQYIVALASPDTPSRHGVVVPRRNRPPDLAAINAISMITFCRNYHARLLPLSHGILYLASHVPIDVIDINCRIGTMPSLETIKASLRGFSAQKAAKIRIIGRDTAVYEVDGRKMVKANLLVFDNSQHLQRQRERRIGRENMMIIGISATLMKFFVDPAALDPLDRRRRISLNLRRTVTVETLLGFIDFDHLRNIGVLQNLSALATYVPACAIYKAEIHLRYRTRCKKRQLPIHKSDLNTLASSGKNEAFIPELKEALLDFQNQFGQTEDDHDFKLWFCGGDGMSFNNSLLVQKYLQNHTESSFQNFETMVPVLQVWHTLWHDTSRIHETHWGTPLNDNPATLGNSAKKIGRPAPPNLKKVDYYPAAELIALVHDMRILDCWRVYFGCENLHVYFEELAASKRLPSFEDLEAIAKELYDTYTSMNAQTEANFDARDGKSAWASKVPLGAPWQSADLDSTSTVPSSKPQRKRKSKQKAMPTTGPAPIFYGDRVKSASTYFMRDASISREATAAVAEGAVGRLWEALKVMLFNFAGSGHSRYMGYMLEMVCHVELESSPELGDATLDSMICNPSGKAGGGQACDLFQERMNRELEPIIQRKDTDYGSKHVRNMWSLNLLDLYELKAEMRQGVGLAKRSGRHKAPHQKPEVKILLEHYRDKELNLRRPGRTFGEEIVPDNFTAGIQKLRCGALTQWARKTTRDRSIRVEASDAEPTVEDSSDEESDEEDSPEPNMTLGLIHAFDGEVVIDLEPETDFVDDTDFESYYAE